MLLVQKITTAGTIVIADMLKHVEGYAIVTCPSIFSTEYVQKENAKMLHKNKVPYIRDLYLAYLIEGARRTKTDEYPIIEKWMVATEPPKELIQWDRRRDVIDPSLTGICFYCNDVGFTPILNNPKAYTDKLKKYELVVGIDPSPYDNMPLCVQKSQIYLNLATTYYFATQGIKVIPNVRIGDNRTLTCLEAFPKHTLIAIGTHGFTHKLSNRFIFADQVMRIVNELEPSGIVVYGPVISDVFSYVMMKDIPIFQYDSYTMKENKKDRMKLMRGTPDEGK